MVTIERVHFHDMIIYKLYFYEDEGNFAIKHDGNVFVTTIFGNEGSPAAVTFDTELQRLIIEGINIFDALTIMNL